MRLSTGENSTNDNETSTRLHTTYASGDHSVAMARPLEIIECALV